MAAKKAYRVLPGHREIVAGVKVVTDQILYLTDAEALYERDLGYIEPVDTSPAPAPPTPFQATDTVILRRAGVSRVLMPAEFAAFFASALGSTPSVPPPSISGPPILTSLIALGAI